MAAALRVGIIGVGMMGQHHARVFSEMEGCELIGIADKDLSRAHEVAERYGVPVVGSAEEMIALRPDAVSVAVPTSLHKEVAMGFLERGIGCLVEKPIAPTIGDAEEMIAAARGSGATLMIGHIERFNPAVLKLKELIQSGELGKVLILSAKRVGPIVPRIKDVGIIIDLATHDIDATRFLAGREPISVCASYGRYKREVEDYAVILLDYGETIAILEANRFTPQKIRTLTATCTDVMAQLNYIDQTLELYSQTSKCEVKVEKREPLRVELEHFLECVRSGERPLVDGTDGLMNLKVALAALKSGAKPEGQPR